MSANPSHLSDPPPPAAPVRSRKHRGNLGRPGLGALRGWVARKRRRIGQAGEGASPQSMARMQKKGPGAFSQGPSVWTARKVRSAGKSGLRKIGA